MRRGAGSVGLMVYGRTTASLTGMGKIDIARIEAAVKG